MQMRPMEPLGDISSILKPMTKPPKRKGRGTQLNYRHRLELQQHWRASNGLGRNSELHTFTPACITPTAPAAWTHTLLSVTSGRTIPLSAYRNSVRQLGMLSQGCPLSRACVPAQPLVPPQPRLHPWLFSMPMYFHLMQKAVCPLTGHIFQLALSFWKLWAIKN